MLRILPTKEIKVFSFFLFSRPSLHVFAIFETKKLIIFHRITLVSVPMVTPKLLINMSLPMPSEPAMEQDVTVYATISSNFLFVA